MTRNLNVFRLCRRSLVGPSMVMGSLNILNLTLKAALRFDLKPQNTSLVCRLPRLPTSLSDLAVNASTLVALLSYFMMPESGVVFMVLMRRFLSRDIARVFLGGV